MQKLVAFILTMSFAISLVAAPKHKLLDNENNTINIFKSAAPLVVNVHRLKSVRNSNADQVHVSTGSASGIIWNQQGYVVTNYHVISGANKIAVTLDKGQTVLAKVVGVEPRKDIAVLKIINPRMLRKVSLYKPFAFADSSQLEVGQKVLAIGNPYGLDRSLSSGIVSALGRNITGVARVKINNMIQTDASINPGNSGGPLLDSYGHLIGMNTMIFSRSGSSAGIGFAVPVNTMKRVVNQIIQSGRVILPGIGFVPLSDQAARQLGIKGVVISKVMPNSPAAKAKLRGTSRDREGNIRIGDVIVNINHVRIKNYSDLYNTLESFKVGDTVEVSYIRDGKLHSIQLRTIDVAKQPHRQPNS